MAWGGRILMQKWLGFKGEVRRNQEAFTLIELMIAAVVFLLAFVGILLSYLTCIDLNEVSKNTSAAVHACKARLEAVKNTQFVQIKGTYHNTTFTTAGLTGKGVVYVDDTNPRLLNIVMSFSWRQPSGRVIGEDKDLDGLLDGGEDDNSNGILDSPVELMTSVFE